MIRASSSFPHLYRRTESGQLYFRYVIPERYRLAFGKCEVKRSLRTTNKIVALPMAMQLYCQLQDQIQRIEGTVMSKKETPLMDIHESMKQWSGDAPDGSIGKVTFKTKGADGKDIEVNVERDDPDEEERIARGILYGGGQSVQQQTQPVQEKTETINKVAKLYRKEKIAEGSWRKKTHGEHEALHGLLVQILRNKPMESITHADARKFKEMLMKLPPNMAKGKFADKTSKQIVAMNPSETMAVKTINEKLGRASSLFSWAVRHGYTSVDPFHGLKLKDNRAAHEQKNRYTQEELNILFNPKYFTLDKLRKPFMYWTPLVSLFSGARLNEIAQLRVIDIQNENGTPFFEITPDARLLKNVSSKRKIPIHPRLVQLGFLKHVEQQRVAGHERVFPEAYGTVNGPADKISKWYRNYRRNLRIGELKKDDGQRKLDFHSFRHTFLDALKQDLIDQRVINALAGHTDKDLASSRYGKPLSISAMYPHLCKIDFELPLEG